ncbi:MAG: hypothetical protein JNM21_11075 [Taibaiella sp.]|nr:hypothetical protein [Taibaiella sp.]
MHITVAIQSSSYQVTDFSEFYLTKLPVFKFNINASTIGEPLTGFCIDLIYETVKNLIIANQLQLSYSYPDKSFWTNGAKVDWWIERTVTDLSPFNWLEQQILSAALLNRQKRLNDFINTILSNCSPPLNILSRYILYKVATTSQSGLITTNTSKRFLSKQLHITINEAVNLQNFIKTEGQSGTEYVANKAFKDFSDTLFSQLRRQLINYQNN